MYFFQYIGRRKRTKEGHKQKQKPNGLVPQDFMYNKFHIEFTKKNNNV